LLASIKSNGGNFKKKIVWTKISGEKNLKNKNWEKKMGNKKSEEKNKD